jgi:hypothetical protein
MTKNTQHSLDTKNKLFKFALDKIMGPGVQERIKRDAAQPKRFPGNDGIRFDPNWQDDIIKTKPAAPK